MIGIAFANIFIVFPITPIDAIADGHEMILLLNADEIMFWYSRMNPLLEFKRFSCDVMELVVF